MPCRNSIRSAAKRLKSKIVKSATPRCEKTTGPSPQAEAATETFSLPPPSSSSPNFAEHIFGNDCVENDVIEASSEHLDHDVVQQEETCTLEQTISTTSSVPSMMESTDLEGSSQASFLPSTPTSTGSFEEELFRQEQPEYSSGPLRPLEPHYSQKPFQENTAEDLWDMPNEFSNDVIYPDSDEEPDDDSTPLFPGNHAWNFPEAKPVGARLVRPRRRLPRPQRRPRPTSMPIVLETIPFAGPARNRQSTVF